MQEKSRSDRKEKKIDKGLERDILKTFFPKRLFQCESCQMLQV